MWELFLICLGVGVGAGLLAGALGLGGGVVIVPALIFLFHGLGFPADLVAKMAVATSLSTIMITSISAVRTHHKAGFVRWPVVLRLGVGIVLGAFAGAFIADAMKGELLTRLFGLFAMVIALQMALTGRKAPEANLPERVPGAAGLGVAGVLIGTGSEVQLAVAAAEKLAESGVKARVVSMPCTDAFDRQSAEYKESVLPAAVTKRVAVEALAKDSWYKYVGFGGAIVGMDTFGESGPAGELFKHFGITTDAVVEAAQSL